jgi:UDP-glucose 4-epimerase
MQLFLVTGGCGFIGSHLCDGLLQAGHRVRVLDDLSSGYVSNLPGGVDFQKGSITDPDALARAVQGVDGCFHLAAIASVEKGVQDWVGTHQVNLSGTINLFNAVRALPNARDVPVVYASSAAVYGDCPTLPITEDVPKAPLSAYGADKYGCELHARVASHVFGIPTTGLRFFNVYGPRQDPKSPYSGVISIFCDRLRRGEGVKIFGDGEQSRDFVFVKDVVAALMAAMVQRPTDAPVFNVCTGRATTVSKLAEVIAGLCGTPAAIEHLPGRAGEIRHSIGSSDAAHAALSLGQPAYLRDGLAEVLTWLGAPAN